MPGYVHGVAQGKNPAAALTALIDRIEQARRELSWLDDQIADATRELTEIQRKAAAARRQHTAYMRSRVTDPATFQAEARIAYEAAVARHPDDLTEGRKRRRQLDRELQLARRGQRDHAPDLRLAG